MDWMLGKKIGGGMSREVFEFEFDLDYVVKVECYGTSFQNPIEFSTWMDVRTTPIAHHFAQCKAISVHGSILIMERTYVPPVKFKWPDKMPGMFTDFKRQNFGLNKKGKLVCHDYGTHMAMYNTGFNKRMKKANWWDDE